MTEKVTDLEKWKEEKAVPEAWLSCENCDNKTFVIYASGVCHCAACWNEIGTVHVDFADLDEPS